MRKIAKGTKINHDAYIITDAERKEYMQLKKTMKLLKEKADNYIKQYKS